MKHRVFQALFSNLTPGVIGYLMTIAFAYLRVPSRPKPCGDGPAANGSSTMRKWTKIATASSGGWSEPAGMEVPVDQQYKPVHY